MNQIVHLSRYFSTSREVRIVQVWAIVHNVISFKQVIQGKHPALLVLAVSDYEAMLTISNMWLEVFQASPSHPHCQCFCRSDAHPSASAGRASKVKIWRCLWKCVIYFLSCVIYFFLGALVLFKPGAWAGGPPPPPNSLQNQLWRTFIPSPPLRSQLRPTSDRTLRGKGSERTLGGKGQW